VSFSERISPAAATNLANYQLGNTNGTVGIIGAKLDISQTNVLLTINALADGGVYKLTVNNLTDQSHAANPISPNSEVQFVASYLRLDCYWKFAATSQPASRREWLRYYCRWIGHRRH
jgi:hypothetical protein